MTWTGILGIVVVLVALVSVFGIRPRGGRPASGTLLMTVARVVLVLVGIVLLYWGSRH
jgi:hypothetical protein